MALAGVGDVGVGLEKPICPLRIERRCAGMLIKGRPVGTFVGTQRVSGHIRPLQAFGLSLEIDTQLAVVIRGEVLP